MTLEEIRKLVEGVPPGPWNIVELTPSNVQTPAGRISVSWRSTDGRQDALAEMTAAFIAASRDLVPKLLAVAEAGKALADAGHFQPRYHPALFAAKRAFEQALAAL